MSLLPRWFRRSTVQRSAVRYRPCLEVLETRRLLTAYTVTTPSDLLNDTTVGQVTLRDVFTAIDSQQASGNAAAGTAGVNTIDFKIGHAASVQTIDLTSPLPKLTQAVFLNGWSQGGGAYSGPPLIILNGSGAGTDADGIELDTGSDRSTVRGLVIQSFSDNGIEIHGANDVTVTANYLGTNVKGTTAVGNGNDAVLIDDGASDNVIGGSSPGSGNVICGSIVAPPGASAGTQASTLALSPANISGDVASFNVTMNYTDTPADEMVYVGIDVRNTASALTTDAFGNPDFSAFNFIPSSNITTGWEAIANAFPGEFLFQTPPSTGGTANGLAPNTSYLIGTLTYNLATLNITPSPSLTVSINGTDTIIGAEQPRKPSTFNWVQPTFSPPSQPLVNSPTSATNGVEISGAGTNGNRVLGNSVGIGPSGNAVVGELTDGVLIDAGASQNTIGSNVIAGNDNGIVMDGPGTSANTVVANRIGTNQTGRVNLANTIAGVLCADGASGNTVGGTTTASTNLIAFNGKGVVIGNSTSDTATVGDAVLGNRIYGNALAAIVLGDQGPTSNGANPRSYPNDGQNTPVLTDVTPHSVGGSLTSVPDTTFRIEFYAEAVGSAPPTQQFLGFLNVTTDATGSVQFTSPINSLPFGEAVVATATNVSNGDTSEFSPIGTQVVILSSPVLTSGHTSQKVPVSIEILTASGPPTTGQVQITVPGIPGTVTVPVSGAPIMTLHFTVPPSTPASVYFIFATVFDEDGTQEASGTGTLTITAPKVAAGVSRRWTR